MPAASMHCDKAIGRPISSAQLIPAVARSAAQAVWGYQVSFDMKFMIWKESDNEYAEICCTYMLYRIRLLLEEREQRRPRRQLQKQ